MIQQCMHFTKCHEQYHGAEVILFQIWELGLSKLGGKWFLQLSAYVASPPVIPHREEIT